MASSTSSVSSAALAGAGTLSSVGLGSGLDVTGIVTKLMDIERQPISNLTTKQATTKAQITAYGTLKSSLATLQTAAKTLSNADTFKSTKAAVADPTILSATTTSAAQPGTYSIEVRELATAQKLLTKAKYASPDDAVGGGTLTFDFGTYADGSFTQNAEKVTKSVTIPEGSSLSAVGTAINAANIGVNAVIVNDGTGYYLSLSPVDTGKSNALRIKATDIDGDNTNNAGLSVLAFDQSTGGTQNMNETVPPGDAELKIDGVAATSALNVIDNAIAGMTLTLTKKAKDAPTIITVSRDDAAVKTAVSGFVKAFNDTSKLLGELLAYNAQTGQSGALVGEGTVRNIQMQLRAVLAQTTEALPGQVGSLSDLGVSFQRDGSLALDDFKLGLALRDPLKDVGKFLDGTDDAPGMATRLNGLIENMLGTGGMLSARISGLNERVSSYDAQKAALERRMAQIENRYREQFSVLDSLVSSMNQTSNYLQQQLANLPKINGGDK